MHTMISVAPTAPVTFGGGSVEPIHTPLTLRATPGSGGTLTVESRISRLGAWSAWPAGAVSVETTYVLTSPVEALRFTATVTAGTVEIAQ